MKSFWLIEFCSVLESGLGVSQLKQGQFDLILSTWTSLLFFFFSTLTCLGLLSHLGSRLNSWKFEDEFFSFLSSRSKLPALSSW